MILSLHIENLAVIKNIDVDFSRGFTAFTGETGAGKSIIIDGINMLLGSKAERELIRYGTDSAMVSGLFSCNAAHISAFKELGISPDDEGNILVQRNITSDGKSTVKLNGRSVSLALLKQVTPYLITIHGQSDTRSLTESKKQLEIVDIYANNAELLKDYEEKFDEYDKFCREINAVIKKESERERVLEILKYQIDDIDALALRDGEEEELIDKKIKIKNSEKITKNAGFVFKALKGSEKGSVAFLLDRSASALEQLSDVIPAFSEYAETLRDFSYRANDIAEEVYGVISDVDEDSDTALNKIESRLDKISKLKRKYGLTIKDILEFRDRARSEYETLADAENILKQLEAKRDAAYKSALSLANVLHEKRSAAAREIEKSVKETLEFLDMPKVVFLASIKESFDNGKKVLSKHGSDEIEFLISANRGADAMPLSKVASGGELARIMLALKSVIADKDGIETVIYDEIDAGVSGKTARKIGIKMLSLAKSAQLIAVTHSAQIASLADTHILIKKSDVNGKTETSLEVLNGVGRVDELSRILGGIDVTRAQRMAAVDMLNEKNDYLRG